MNEIPRDENRSGLQALLTVGRLSHGLDELFQPRGGKAGRLSGREGSQHQRADDEGKDGAGLLCSELVSAALPYRFHLFVYQTAQSALPGTPEGKTAQRQTVLRVVHPEPGCEGGAKEKTAFRRLVTVSELRDEEVAVAIGFDFAALREEHDGETRAQLQVVPAASQKGVPRERSDE